MWFLINRWTQVSWVLTGINLQIKLLFIFISHKSCSVAHVVYDESMESGSLYKVWNTTLHRTWISGMLCGTNQGEADGQSMQTIPNFSRNSRWGNGWIKNKKFHFKMFIPFKFWDATSMTFMRFVGNLASRSDFINCKTNVFLRFFWFLFENILQFNKLTKKISFTKHL